MFAQAFYSLLCVSFSYIGALIRFGIFFSLVLVKCGIKNTSFICGVFSFFYSSSNLVTLPNVFRIEPRALVVYSNHAFCSRDCIGFVTGAKD